MSLRKRTFLVVVGTVLLLIASPRIGAVAANGPTQTIPATDMEGIRSLNGGTPFLLTFGGVNFTVEDRTSAHFSMAQVYPSFSSVTLNIPLDDIDPNDPTGDLDVYAFNGGKTVVASDYNAGTFYDRITGISGNLSTPTVDVTPLVTSALATHADYLVFVFRQHENGDRYAMYPLNSGVAGIATLSVSVVPEPSAISIVAIVMAYVFPRRRRPTSHNRV